MTEKAAAFVKANGKAKLIEKVNAKDPDFFAGELYVAVLQADAMLIEAISRANAEQRHGVKSIATMLDQLDTTTRQNAALVEEAAAATSLRQESGRLVEAVSMFHIEAAPS